MHLVTPALLRRFAPGLILVAALRLAAQEPAGEAWPHWRGPARDGISPEKQWSSVGQPEPLWSAELGLGYSNVVIRDGRLFTLGFDEAAGMDRLFCLDAATGEERWRKTWPAEIIANLHRGGTLTTPAIDGDVLFASNREGRAVALRVADGEELWQKNYADELGLEIPFHGFSASPLALPDRLILVLGGTVVAVDKRTGDVLWRTENHGDGGYATPVPFELDGRTRLCVYLGIGPMVLDAETGTEICRYPWKPKAGGVNVCTPIVFGRKIFISSAYNQGAALLELGDDAQPTLLWRSRRMRNKVSGCVLWQDHIYGFDESMLKCIDLQGQEKWRVRGLGLGSVTLAGGRLIVLTSKGELIIGEASPAEFRQLSRRKVLDGGVYWTSPVLLSGRIYCRNSLGSLVCLDHRAGPEPAEAAAVATRLATGEVPAAEHLFAAHARAIGGDKLRARRSLHIEGTIEMSGEGVVESAMTIDKTAPDKWRLSFEMGQFGTMQRGFDGEIGWSLNPFEGDWLLEGDELREVRELQRLHAPIEWQTTYTEVETTGSEEFADRACWVVEATSPGGAVRRFFFDAENDRLIGHDAEGESMVVHAEWREFDGIELPTRTTIVAPDTGNEEIWVITSAKWDAVEAGAHERPDAVRRLLRSPEEIEAANRAARIEFARYLGTYTGDVGQGLDQWKVVVANGDLAIDAGDKPMGYVKTGKAHQFALRGAEHFVIEFRVDGEGAVTGLVFDFGDKTFEFKRDR